MAKFIQIIGLFYVIGITGLTAQESSAVDIEVKEGEEVNIPFSIIHEVPIFPGCEDIEKINPRNCFTQQLQKHISTHFRYPEKAKKENIQGTVQVGFTIDPGGNVTSIKTNGNPILEEEARRIIVLLPRMVPGKQNHQTVSVPFFLPIHFNL